MPISLLLLNNLAIIIEQPCVSHTVLFYNTEPRCVCVLTCPIAFTKCLKEIKICLLSIDRLFAARTYSLDVGSSCGPSIYLR